MSGVYTHGSGPTERDTTMRDLLAVIFKRKWLILSVFLVTTVSVGFKTLTSPVTYSAEATLLLNRQGVRASQLEVRGSRLPWVEVVESEMEVVRSVPVLQAASARLREPTDEFPEGIQIGFRALGRRVNSGVIGESNVLFVGASASTPAAARFIANAVAESYLEHHKELFRVPEAATFIRDEADSMLQSLEAAQGRRAALLTSVGVSEIQEEERALVDQRRNLRLSLSAKQMDRRSLETSIEDGRAYLEGDLVVRSVPFHQFTGTTHGHAISQAVEELRRRRVALADLSARYTEEYPEVVDLRHQVESSTAEVRNAVERAISAKEHELRVVRGGEEDLREQIEQLDATLAALPEIRSTVELLDAQIEAMSARYADLVEQAVNSEVNEASSTDYGVRMLSRAMTARQNKRGDLVRMALGPILALMAGIGLAFYLENLDHSFQNREDVERHLEIPVLASFPDSDLSKSGLDPPSRRLPFQGEKSKSG